MLDEAQDANPCILDILANQNCQVIYVGDEHQQIYEFRGTINAMQTLDLPMLYLTQSFRFGNAIANQANTVLEMLGSQSFVKGLPSINSKLAEIKNVPYTLLARTNAKLFEKCIIAIQEGYNCSLVADVHKIVLLISSVFYLWIKKPEWVKDERMMRFKVWQDLLEYVDAEDDAEMLGAINFVLTNKTRTLDLLKLIRESGKFLEDRADIIFSTAHKSKGKEWDNVIIADDFRLDKDQDKNLYYVALTRAKKILDHEWPVSKKGFSYNQEA
jgi:superfamily I DNA/RNA helicase